MQAESIPWARLVRLSVASSVAAFLLCLTLVHVYSSGNPVSFIAPGADGPSAAVVDEDFSDLELPESVGHDGQQFYAVARQPMHLEAAAESLDDPRYRLQRILFPALAWALHPSGGGLGLVWAMVLVNVAAMALGSIATGALAHRLRAPLGVAAAFPLLPGVIAAARIGTGDILGTALVLAAIALALSERARAAVMVAVLAVLAKESLLLVLLGWLLHRRDRRAAVMLAVPAAVAGGWALWLRLTVPSGENNSTELVAPFTGLARAIDYWSGGQGAWAMASVLGGVLLGAWGLRRHGLNHPLSWIVAIQLGLVAMLGRTVLAGDFNGPRATLVLQLTALLLALSPRQEKWRSSGQSSDQGTFGPAQTSTGVPSTSFSAP